MSERWQGRGGERDDVRRSGRGLVPAALGLALLVAGGWMWFGQSEEAQVNALADTAADTVAVVDPDAAAEIEPEAEPALPEPPAGRSTPGAPQRLTIAELGVDAPVVPVRTAGETLVPPSDAQTLGWWSQGAEPGARRGSALVTGHTVHAGEGALDELESLEEGDEVGVVTEEGELSYRVTAVEVFGKGTVAAQADRLFSQEVPGRLVVITCEDWDGERYLSNVVVTATPA